MSDLKSEVSIKPEDSVSHCDDDGVARSAVSSTSSSASRLRVKAKARRAAVAAEAEGLRRLQEIELEQFKLKQRRSQLELQTRLDIAEAEEFVYTSLCDEEKSSHSTSQHKSSVKPPQAAASRLPGSRDLDDTIPYPVQDPPSNPAHNGGRSSYPQAAEQSDVQLRLIEAVSLRNAEVMKFNGDPLHYFEFIRSFRQSDWWIYT